MGTNFGSREASAADIELLRAAKFGGDLRQAVLDSISPYLFSGVRSVAIAPAQMTSASGLVNSCEEDRVGRECLFSDEVDEP